MDVKYTGENTLAALIAEVIDRFASKNDIAHLLPVPATSEDGAAYTATVPGVTELYNGLNITVIPDKASTSTAVTLNVNGLGAKYIKVPLTTSTGTLVNARQAGYYLANRPITLQYDSSYSTSGAWKVLGNVRPDANDIYGTIDVSHGGTGATTPAGALANLGVTYGTDDLTAGESELTTGAVYLVYE